MKQRLIFAIKAAVSALLVWWLLERVDMGPVIDTLSRVSAAPLFFALAVVLAATSVAALRWMTVNRALDIPLRWARALRLTFIGLFFNQTLPSTIGGDVARVWFLYRDGVPMKRALSGVVLDRLSALAALLALVGLSLPASLTLIEDPGPRWSLPILVAAGGGGFALLGALGGRGGAYLVRWKAMAPLLSLAQDVRRVFAWRTGMAAVVALALLIHLSMVLTVWLIGLAIAAEIPLLYCLVFVPPVLLVTIVPVSVAGWGLREGAMVVAFGFVGVPEADALVVSLILGVTLVVAGAPGGLLWLAEGARARRSFGVSSRNSEP